MDAGANWDFIKRNRAFVGDVGINGVRINASPREIGYRCCAKALRHLKRLRRGSQRIIVTIGDVGYRNFIVRLLKMLWFKSEECSRAHSIANGRYGTRAANPLRFAQEISAFVADSESHLPVEREDYPTPFRYGDVVRDRQSC